MITEDEWEEIENLKKKAGFHMIDQIDLHRSTAVPVISPYKQKIIESKLKIDKEAHKSFLERQEKDQDYVNCGKNPFFNSLTPRHKFSNIPVYYSEKKPLEQKKPANKTARKPLGMKKIGKIMYEAVKEKKQVKNEKEDKNFITQLERLKLPIKVPTTRLMKEIEQIQETRKANETNSKRIIYSLEYQKSVSFGSPKSQIDPFSFPTTDNAKTEEKKNNLKLTSLTDIVKSKEKSFFFNKKIDIFNLEEEVNHKYLLNQFSFAFDRIVEHVPKIKIPVACEISAIGRQMITNLNLPQQDYIDYIDITETIPLAKQKISYEDIMNAASGRINPSYLSLDLDLGRKKEKKSSPNNNKEDVSESSQSNEEDSIVYIENTQNFISNFKGDNEEKDEIIDYKTSDFVANEARNLQKCARFSNRIKRVLTAKEDVIRNNIKDYKTLQNYSTMISSEFSGEWESIQDKNNVKDIDKAIRFKKVYKDRVESNKIENFVNNIKMKQEFDDKARKAMNQRKRKEAELPEIKEDEENHRESHEVQDESHHSQQDLTTEEQSSLELLLTAFKYITEGS